MLEEILDVILDALLDGLKVLPFLFLIYMLMEIIEGAKNKEKIERALSGSYAPIVASGLGIIPECGFSVMCSKLYAYGMITLGTLISAFISTSDEGIIVLLTSKNADYKEVLLIILIKLLYAIVVGLIINALMKKYNLRHICPKKDECIECGEHHGKKFDRIIIHPLWHAVKTFLYIVLINAVIGLIIYFIGEEKIYSFMDAKKGLQPLICALFGLIPNCGSSVFLAEAYLNNLICIGALLSGLSANAGIGLLIILKDKNSRKKALIILPLLFILAIFLGYITLWI